MVFIDTKRKLGAGEVGSSNIATAAVYRQKLAPSSVGTVAEGTISLSKAIGTLSSASIGSLHLSYGSAGTFAGRNIRAGIGSFQRFAGTLQTGKVYGGTFVVARIPSLASAYIGTLGVQRLPSLASAYIGTLSAPRIPSLSSALTGTLSAARMNALGSLRGSLTLVSKVIGTLASPRIGTHSASKITYGTLTQPIKAATGSFTGTTYGRKFTGVLGSFTGSVTGHKAIFGGIGSFTGTVWGRKSIYSLGSAQGTQYGRKATFGQGTIGALRVGTLNVRSYGSTRGTQYARVGSFSRFAGTMRAAGISSGTVARARLIQTVGTHIQGSFGGNQVKARYVVWPSAFPNGTYFPWASYLFRGGSPPALGAGQFAIGFVTKVAGSARYYVTRNAAPDAQGSAPPLGSIFFFGG